MHATVLAGLLAIATLLAPHAAAEACEAGHEPSGMSLKCQAAGSTIIVILGDHQNVSCDQNDGNIVVIVGDHNHVHCTEADA